MSHHFKKPDYRVGNGVTQLQALTEGRRNIVRFSIDDPAQMDVEALKRFSREYLHIDPSISTILRRALSAYFESITAKVIDLKVAQKEGRSVAQELAAFMQEERDGLFHAARQPEKAQDLKYRVDIG